MNNAEIQKLVDYLRSNKTNEEMMMDFIWDRYIEHGECFSSSCVHPNHEHTQANWKKLSRGCDHEELVKQWVQNVRANTMVTYDGLLSLANQVRYVEENGIEGDYVETGCWKGGAAGIIALASLEFGKPRKIHLFDSFQGLPQPDASRDTDDWIEREWKVPLNSQKGELKPIGALLSAKQDVEELLFNRLQYPRECVQFHIGWFQDTLPIAHREIEKIAILRLDGDLYDSTIVCLEHLYPKVVSGGFVIVDDYALSGARKAVHDYFRKKKVSHFLSYVDSTVRYFIK